MGRHPEIPRHRHGSGINGRIMKLRTNKIKILFTAATLFASLILFSESACAQHYADYASGAEGFEVDLAVLGPGEVAAWLGEHGGDGRAGLAVSGRWGRGTGVLEGVALGAADGAAAFIDPAALAEDDDKALAGWLTDPAKPKALHDAKGPMHAMAAHGLHLGGLTSDTALAAYLALPGQRSFDLADLALRYLNRELRGGGSATGQLTLEMSGE